MRFDPVSQALYTEAGALIKHLHCPLRKQWDELAETDNSPHRRCDHCQRVVTDTASLTEADVLAAVQADPTICLKVSALQENLTVIWPTGRHRRRVD